MAPGAPFSVNPSSLSTSLGNLTENTYSILRADILACRLRPGQRLKIHEICSRLRVSPGAVREALSRLSAEELVVSEAQKGFRVAPVRVDDLEDLTRTRIEIECMCLRRAIGIGGIEWETGLVAASHRLTRIASPLDSDAWAHAHAQYHLALVDACDSAWLLRLRALLYAQSERYRRLSLSSARIERDVDAEHRALVEAALARDAARACALLADHLSLTAALVRSLEEKWHAPHASEPVVASSSDQHLVPSRSLHVP
jgi:DNA-binding GntR family transcriptional regulator